MKQQIVVLGGLGDVFLALSLYEAFSRQHPTHEIELIIKSGHAAIAGMFPGVRWRADDVLTFGTEANPAFQRSYNNDLFIADQPFFLHPRMARTPLLIDEMPSRPFICQADLFRTVLGLPLTTPLTVATPPVTGQPKPGTVMIVEANTWPNTQLGFYPKLVAGLIAAGRDVWVNDKTLPLADLLQRAADTEWAIGPQCGLMSIFITGRFPCRKTLATPSIDNGGAPLYWASETFPYASVTRFAGLDFDVEEYKITDDNHDELVSLIVDGLNASGVQPHDPQPIETVMMPLTPGDFLDRFAVLVVKRTHFSAERRRLIEREYQRHVEAARDIGKRAGVHALLMELIGNHSETFVLLERAVPLALSGNLSTEDHVAAMRLNRERIAIKQKIDAALHAPYTETKSYYEGHHF